MSVVFLTVTMMIGHTEEHLTADHKWMPAVGPTSRKGLEKDKLVAIPLVNEGFGVVFTSRVVIGKGKKSVNIDNEELHLLGTISLKRLQFDKVSS